MAHTMILGTDETTGEMMATKAQVRRALQGAKRESAAKALAPHLDKISETSGGGVPMKTIAETMGRALGLKISVNNLTVCLSRHRAQKRKENAAGEGK